MKRLIVLTGAGALMALQGCAVEADFEDTGTATQRVECSVDQGGLYATKAALAVAMAEELGELDPLRQLELKWYQSGDPKVGLKAGACPGSCPKTEALLDFQDEEWMQIIPQSTFSATNYRRDLVASLERQATTEADLNNNNPADIPGDHILTLSGTNDGVCGVNYVFDVDAPGCDPIYTIKGVQSGRCLDIAWGSSDNGANLQIYDCHGGDAQQFALQDLGNGYALMRNVRSGKCLDVSNFSTANGANVVQWDCHGGTNQQFQAVNSGGQVHFINRNSGKALDVANFGTANGSNIHQWAYGGGSNQQYTLSQVSAACSSTPYTGDTADLKNRLVFFGGDANPYLDFQSTSTTISIDPDVADSGGSLASDNLGTCDSTTLCRVWDPTWERSGCCVCDGVPAGGWQRYARNPNYAICKAQ